MVVGKRERVMLIVVAMMIGALFAFEMFASLNPREWDMIIKGVSASDPMLLISSL